LLLLLKLFGAQITRRLDERARAGIDSGGGGGGGGRRPKEFGCWPLLLPSMKEKTHSHL
jgi:hypothetical protein